MSNEKELSQFRALDFDAEDILFSSLVRYHFEREAAEDLEKLNAGEFDAMPEETDSARKRAEKYYRREQRLRILRHGYHVMQKVSVFLIVLIAGFTYLTINVDSVNRAVVNWLTEIYQTHTHLSIELNDSNVDLSNVKINWVPEGVTVQRLDSSIGSFILYYKNQSIGSIICQNYNSNMSLNTENAKVNYLSLVGFDKVLLIEHEKAISLLATSPDIVITIIVTRDMDYTFSVGEVLNILQNIDY